MLEAIGIKLNTQSKKEEVQAFLDELQEIFELESFNIETDLTIIKTKKKGDKAQYSTPYTLLDLDYDAEDIVERLKELTVGEYSETLFDKDDVNPPLLFVFGKSINKRLVYIKLKIKGDGARHVLCVSFHYAAEAMSFPYA